MESSIKVLLSTKKVLAKLDVYEHKKSNKLYVVGTQSKSKRWVPLEDNTRLLHCMFAQKKITGAVGGVS